MQWMNIPAVCRRPAWWITAGGVLIGAASAHASQAGAAGQSHFWPLTFQIINFVLLIIMLTLLLKRPLGTFLLNRRERISRSIDEATETRANAEAELAQYEERLNNLSREVDKLRERFAAEGEADKERLIAAAEVQAERLGQAMKNLARQELARARMELQHEIGAQALSEAAAILRENLEEKDHEKLIENYVAKVG